MHAYLENIIFFSLVSSFGRYVAVVLSFFILWVGRRGMWKGLNASLA